MNLEAGLVLKRKASGDRAQFLQNQIVNGKHYLKTKLNSGYTPSFVDLGFGVYPIFGRQSVK
jgi:hypothetical protein